MLPLLAAGWGLFKPLGAAILAPLRPFASYFAIAGAAAIVLYAAHQAGANGERARGAAASLRAELAIARIDLALNRMVAESARRDAEAADARARRDEALIRDYARQLAAAPACRADRRDVDLDRRLRGGSKD